MLRPSTFYEALLRQEIDFFAGVPDSLLKDLCAYITDHSPADRHLITANEGSAVALAAGYYLATGRIGVVYLQNSGLGNTVNPLTSLADPEVYGIPMLLLVGWRGEPGGKKDEPQHVKMGKVTVPVLDAIGIEHAHLPAEIEAAERVLEVAAQRMKSGACPYALVISSGTFEKYKLSGRGVAELPLSREEALEILVEAIEPGALIVSTTGKPSRELFEIRERRGEPHDTDFLTVGSMGHASQIALGVALHAGARPVYCVDGDGAVLMHMGGLATLGTAAPANFKHIVVNNGAHESVGGQPTVALDIDLGGIARSCGYQSVFLARSAAELRDGAQALREAAGPAFFEVRVRVGARDDLGRPTMSPRDLKHAFMKAARNG